MNMTPMATACVRGLANLSQRCTDAKLVRSSGVHAH